jgi:SAM-dependent methyltransferase
MRYRKARLSKLPIAAAFDEIYKKKMWKQGDSLSGIGSEGEWARKYVQIISELIDTHSVRTIVDFGCGDFSVGSKLVPKVDKMIAIDISETIISINRDRYKSPNVEFRAGNLLTDAIPDADLVLVRQVLQHLTNAQVESAIQNLERSSAKWIVVTEDVPYPFDAISPNLDMPSHSMDTRCSINSGIDLSAPPFSRAVETIAVIPSGDQKQALVMQMLQTRSANRE